MIEIDARLDELKALGLHHRTRLVSGPQGPHVVLDGKPVLVLCSENYLGLADHPRVREAAAEALENYAIFVRRAKEVAAAVSEHFALAEADVIRVHEVAAPVELIKDFDVDSNFLEKKAKGAGLATFQKAYSGMLMFTMLTHLAGLAIMPIFLPVAGLAPALLMGRAGLMDDRRRRLEQRRAEAKATVRRFVDDFNLQVGKDSRDAVRHVQRELRSA